jgi:hypothetical protein
MYLILLSSHSMRAIHLVLSKILLENVVYIYRTKCQLGRRHFYAILELATAIPAHVFEVEPHLNRSIIAAPRIYHRQQSNPSAHYRLSLNHH